MDILIPLYKSKTDYLDLRYCLRSIEKYLKNYGNIYLIGEKPNWVKNVIHIPFKDNQKKEFKECNIYHKVLHFCFDTSSTSDFFFMNDDHILLKEISTANYPYYSNGDLTERMGRNKSNYRATLNHTRKYLRSLGLPETHFDVHCPIVYNKELFIKSFDRINWEREWGYAIKSIYAGVNKKHPDPFTDCKIISDLTITEIEQKLSGRHVMSCDDGALKENLLTYLNRELNEKSQYES